MIGLETDHLDELVQRARALDLGRTETWLQLLHARRPPYARQPRSRVDDPRFFLAPDGHRDPQAELEATLAAFFGDELREDAQHPQCAFIARYHWLKERLGFDPGRLRERECPLYAQAREGVGEVAGVSLVFAEAFMNNPASMFGHTLLRLDAGGERGGRDLLGWAVNFAGITGNEIAPLYAFKGIVGMYPGYYGMGPYAEKVKEYGDWENRGIWEYRLSLAPHEIERMLMHLWELQGILFDYYYFDENCSYQLLALLQTARPGLDLTQGFPLWVIPSDTVRAVVEEQGLLESVAWRPSAAARLRAETRALSADEFALAKRVAAGESPPEGAELGGLDPPVRARVLSAAYDLLRYRFLARKISRDESAVRARAILVARSRVPGQSGPQPAPVQPAQRPDEGHATARVALEGGWQDDRAYVEFRARPAFHDLLDPQGGYLPGAQIRFLEVALRWYPEDGEVRLQEGILLDIVSISPWDRLFRPISWRFDTGLRTRLISDSKRNRDPEPVWRSRMGAGLAKQLGQHALAYGFAQAVFDVGGALDTDVALGAGGRAGLLLDVSMDRWRADLFAETAQFFAGDTTTSISGGLEQRLTLTRNAALRVRASYHRDFGADWVEAGLRWDLHF